MKPRSRNLLRASHLTLIAVTLGSISARAGTTWDGGGATNTDINLADNWDGTAPGVVNSLDGTTAGIFGTGGNSATMNVNGYFSTLTFNRNDAAGFTVNGPQTLSVKNSGSGATVNFTNIDTVGNGITTINAPFQINTSTGTTRLLTATNLEAGTTTPSLVFANTISASTPASTYGLRFGGAGTTRINGAISNTTGIQQTFLTGTGQLSGTVIIAGNQTLGSSSSVNIAATSSGNVTSTARIQMGETATDIQSWGTTTINQAGTVTVNSTATLSGAVAICTATSNGVSGGTLEVNGGLTATTLGIGSSVYTGKLKVGGTASFSGAVTVGSTAGSTIVGNAATNGTLSLSSGTISDKVTLGGAGTNENNLNLTKINGSALVLNGTHTYTGTTTVSAGTLTVGGTIASATTVNSGGAIGGTGSIGNTLTFGAGNTTLNYDLTGPLNASFVDVSAATAVVVSTTATPVNGTPYVALKRTTGTFSGVEFAKFTLATRGGALSLTGGNTEITVTPAAAASTSLLWKGNLSNAWEASPVLNWSNGGSPDRFYTDDAVTFDNTAASFAVTIAGASVSPGNMVFDSTSPNDYTVSGGTIGGSGSFTKKGSGTVTLSQSGTNTFSGPLSLEAGVLSISNLNQIGGGTSTRAITLKGGTLQYTGATQTTDAVPLVLDSNTSTINVTTSGITLRFGAATTGSGNLIKAGSGILALGKNGTGTAPNSPITGNTFTGTVQVTAGSLDVRNPDSLGAFGATQGTSLDNATLDIFPFGQNQGITLDPEPLAISGNSFFRSTSQDADSDVTNEWTGPITVNANAIVGLGSPKANANFVSKLIISGPVTTGNGSVLNLGYYSATVPSGIQEIDITGALTGSASVTAQGTTGSIYLLTSPGYSGSTTVNSATLKLDAPNPNNQSSTVTIAAGGKLELNFDESGGPVTDTVDKLIVGGVQQGAGVYKAIDNVTDSGTGIAQITGPGTLTVTSNPSGFSSWATSNGIPGASPGADADSDGQSNLTEYALGTSPTASSPSPGTWTGSTITFNKGAAAVANQDVNYIIETSTDLGLTDPWTAVVTQNAPNLSNTISYTFTPGSPARKFARLRVVLIP